MSAYEFGYSVICDIGIFIPANYEVTKEIVSYLEVSLDHNVLYQRWNLLLLFSFCDQCMALHIL